MPSRFTVLGILAFWLFASGWLFYRDIWPGLKPGEPPPFVIDLADEASARASQIRWKIIRNGEDKGYAVTSVRNNPAKDMYELHCEYRFFSRRSPTTPQLAPDQIITSMYGVTGERELKEVQATVLINFGDSYSVKAEFYGNVENRRFRPQINGTLEKVLPGGKNQELLTLKHDFEAVAVSSRGSVLNPLQPVNRLPRLRRGQRWSMPMIDPLNETVKTVPMLKAFRGPDITWLEVEVLAQTQILTWGHDEPAAVECLVVEFHGQDVDGRIWVRANDFLVLLQEINHQGDKIKLVRE